jgi:hypothetical protein
VPDPWHGRVKGASPLPALGALPLPRNPLRLQPSRDSLCGAWCGGRSGVSSADQVVGVDDRSGDQAANREDQLGGEEGERPEQLEDRERGPEEGGHEDSDPAKERSEDGTDPQHEGSMR